METIDQKIGKLIGDLEKSSDGETDVLAIIKMIADFGLEIKAKHNASAANTGYNIHRTIGEVIKMKNSTVYLQHDDEKRLEVTKRILDWVREHDAWGREDICQSDDTVINAASLIGNILDDILKPIVKSKDDE